LLDEVLEPEDLVLDSDLGPHAVDEMRGSVSDVRWSFFGFGRCSQVLVRIHSGGDGADDEVSPCGGQLTRADNGHAVRFWGSDDDRFNGGKVGAESLGIANDFFGGARLRIRKRNRHEFVEFDAALVGQCDS